MKHKTLSVDVKDADQGVIQAVFSTLNVKDHDGDVTLPGAFENGAEVRISQYNHASWNGGAFPVGKGKISSDGEKATLTGQFFLKTSVGRDTFEAVKELGSLGEWSYGFDVLESEHGTHDGEPVQFLKKLKVHEVSPVLLGAGIGTHTVAAKSLGSMTDDELAEEAERAFKALHDRGIAIPDVLAKAVHAQDAMHAAAAELKRRKDGLRVLAAIRGISYEGAA